MNKSGCSAVAAFALAMLGPGTAAADAIQDWNVIMLATTSAQNPLAQSRFAAITHLAMFEAVNAVTGDYEPYRAPWVPQRGHQRTRLPSQPPIVC